MYTSPMPIMDTSSSNHNGDIFELTISNGAAQLLKKLMDHYKVDSSKEVLSVAMTLLDAAKEGEIFLRKTDGAYVQLTIPQPKNAEEGKA